MANPEHVRVLLSGAEKWSRFLHEHHTRSRGNAQQPVAIDLTDAELSSADLSYRVFHAVDFTGANLQGASFACSRLGRTILRGANLTRAKLQEAHFAQSDLSGANLTDGSVDWARFHDTDLSSARLTHATMSRTIFHGATLVGTDFSDAMTAWTVWGNVGLHYAHGLESIRHGGPSSVGLDTIMLSAGQIPEVFLRGCGVPDEIMAYVRSLALSASPIQLYSCFISHSSKDGEFCQRLHNDLQAAGVRCWFAPEDLKVGDRFRDEIEDAIRLHDKLLLVLSDASVNSEWVQTEVESALERERRQRVQVLFPVRLDETVMETPQAWAADIRRKRHIGDFSGWKQHDQYKRTFDRLLRDLRAKPK
jgi:hypothetical protein